MMEDVCAERVTVLSYSFPVCLSIPTLFQFIRPTLNFWRVLGRFAVQVVFGAVCIGDVDLMGLWLYLI